MRESKTLLAAFFLLAFAFGCGPPSSPSSGGQVEIPDLSDEVINERINYTWVGDVPEVNGATPPISWNFDEDEPKQITVVDKQVNGTRATVVLDIKTESSPRSRVKRELSGQIRTEWRLETGWVLRKWEVVKSENISMKYKDHLPPPGSPPPLPTNGNANSNVNANVNPNANR